MARVKSPPIGIMPEIAWRKEVLQDRIQELEDVIERCAKAEVQEDPAWQSELDAHKKEFISLLLGEIKSEYDFEQILKKAHANSMGSRARCADELLRFTPENKKSIVFSAIARLSRARDWNWAGD